MNILNKIYINDKKSFLRIMRIKGKNKLLITTAGRRKTDFCRNFLTDAASVDIDFEPEIKLIDELYIRLKNKNYSGIIAYGGGSVIDSAKILSVALQNKLKPSSLLENFRAVERKPLIAVPTTLGSGSEATGVGVYIRNGKKISFHNDLLIPDYIFIFDESFKGINEEKMKIFVSDSFCHAVESFYSKNANCLTKKLSIFSLKIIIDNFHEQNKTNLAFAGTIAGIADNIAGVSVIHALSYPLQNILKLSHAAAINIILGYCRDGSIFGNKDFSELNKYNLNGRVLKKFIPELIVPFGRLSEIDPQKYARDCLGYSKILSNFRLPLTKRKLVDFYKRIKKGQE